MTRATKAQGKKLPKAPPAPAIELPPAAEVRTLARLDVDPQLLVDSPLNPRRIYVEGKIVELASSMRRVGWFGEIIARPRRDHHAGVLLVDMAEAELEQALRAMLLAGDVELICGHRRKRGAVLAELPLVRVEVRELTDDQALELMVAENLDRADMHPLEEGDAFRALLAMPVAGAPEIPRTVEGVAARVGRSVAFVRQRLRLADLIPTARAAFEGEEILVGHAMLIAALPADRQEEALGHALGVDYQGERASVGDLREAILRSNRRLDDAPWKKDDPALYPEAGACDACPKRTGAEGDLFPSTRWGDSCLDSTCFEEKRSRFVTARFAVAEAKHGHGAVVAVSSEYSHYGKKKGDAPPARDSYTEVKKGECDSARPALVVDGSRDLGKALTVCTNKSCKVHHGSRSSSGSSSDAKWRAQRKAEQEKQKLDAEVKRRTMQKLALKVREDGADVEDLRMVLLAFWSAAWAEVRSFLAQAKGWEERGYDADGRFKKAVTETGNEADLKVLLLELALAQAIKGTSRDALPLKATAKRHGVDEARVRAEVVSEKKSHAKAKKKPAKKKAAKGRK